MSVKKTVAVGTRQQLVDLNGDVTNFDLTFTATSRGGEPFDVLVVDQTTLDNNPSLEFRKAEGTISGNIVADKNVYQNYFLCVKADKPCDVDVIIDLKRIEPVPQKLSAPPPLNPPHKPTGTNWKAVIAVLAIIGGCMLMYYLYSKNRSGSTQNNNVSPSVYSSKSATPSSVPTPIPLPQTDTSAFPSLGKYGFKKANASLIERLNRLPVN